MNQIKAGDAVVAVAGREMGEYFLVAEVKDNYLSLVNGKSRKLDAPKQKKVIHVQKLDVDSGELGEALKKEKLTDADVRKFLKEISKGE